MVTISDADVEVWEAALLDHRRRHGLANGQHGRHRAARKPAVWRMLSFLAHFSALPKVKLLIYKLLIKNNYLKASQLQLQENNIGDFQAK